MATRSRRPRNVLIIQEVDRRLRAWQRETGDRLALPAIDVSGR